MEAEGVAGRLDENEVTRWVQICRIVKQWAGDKNLLSINSFHAELFQGLQKYIHILKHMSGFGFTQVDEINSETTLQFVCLAQPML